MLERNPPIAQTKVVLNLDNSFLSFMGSKMWSLSHQFPILEFFLQVGELAKFFLWDPFFPIHMDDTLFHVLLLFSKHHLQAVPVTEKSNSVVSGFVSQVNYFEWHLVSFVVESVITSERNMNHFFLFL